MSGISWGLPLVAGIFTLVGVVVAQIVTIVLDKVRTRREDERRWHADRRRVYVEYFAAMRTAWDETSRTRSSEPVPVSTRSRAQSRC